MWAVELAMTMRSRLSRLSVSVATVVALLVSTYGTVVLADSPQQTTTVQASKDKCDFQMVFPAWWPPSREELVALGFSPSDAQSALRLYEQYGISPTTFLADIKAGKTWPEIFAANLQGVKERWVRRPYSGPAIDEAGIRDLIAKGYARMDILSAASLAREYERSTEEVLAMRTSGLAWTDIEGKLMAMQSATRKLLYLPAYLFDETGRIKSRSRLTPQQVWEIVDQGLYYWDIIEGDLLGEYLDIPLDQLLARRKAGESWADIQNDLFQHCRYKEIGPRLLSEEELAKSSGQSLEQIKKLMAGGFTLKEMNEAWGITQEYDDVSLAQALEAYKKNGRAWTGIDFGMSMLSVVATLGLSREQIKPYKDQGFTNHDLLMANSYVSLSGVTLDQALASFVKQGRDWSTFSPTVMTRELASGSTGGQPQYPTETVVNTLKISQEQVAAYNAQGFSNRDLLMAGSYVRLTGRTLDEVLAAFVKQGRDWTTFSEAQMVREITAPPPEHPQETGCRTPFVDVAPTHPACPALSILAERKVATGFLDKTFRPDQGITRAEFAKLMAITLGWQPEPGRALPFSDVSDHWAAAQGYLQAAVEHKAITGYADGTFRPNDPLTRAQLVKIAAAASGLTAGGTPPYSDIAPTDWFAGWVAAAAKAGLIGAEAPSKVWVGVPFSGDLPATRGEAAILLANLLARS